MPLYEYVCPECNLKFEEFKSMRYRRISLCPECGHRANITPSKFTHHWLNPLVADGEGFTSKYHRPEELQEINKSIRER